MYRLFIIFYNDLHITKMVVFHSYVKLSKGTLCLQTTIKWNKSEGIQWYPPVSDPGVEARGVNESKGSYDGNMMGF